jgi:hypothetical protein
MFASQHHPTTQATITHSSTDDYRDKRGGGEAFAAGFSAFLSNATVEVTH